MTDSQSDRCRRGRVLVEYVVVRCDGDARGAAARPDASVPWLRVAATLPPLADR